MNRSTSLYLDIIRPLAALIVFLSHISFKSLSGGQLSFMGGTGVQAVDIFFVLSGFVIAHVTSTKETDTKSYFVSRASRIYSVAIPAIILTVILDSIGTRISPISYSGPFQAMSPGLLIRSLFFVGEKWNAHNVPGSNGPYWSLGFEVWYYIAFGVFMFTPGKWRWPAVILVLAFIGPKVTLMFPAWLMGVFAYHFCSTRRLPETAGWILFISSFLMVGIYQITPHSPLQQFTAFSLTKERFEITAQDYFLSAVCCANIIGFAAISHRFARLLEKHARSIRWIAGGTFSLYLIHMPIMHLVSALSPWPKTSRCTLFLILALVTAFSYLFAEVSERRKNWWKNIIIRLYDSVTIKKS